MAGSTGPATVGTDATVTGNETVDKNLTVLGTFNCSQLSSALAGNRILTTLDAVLTPGAVKRLQWMS